MAEPLPENPWWFDVFETVVLWGLAAIAVLFVVLFIVAAVKREWPFGPSVYSDGTRGYSPAKRDRLRRAGLPTEPPKGASPAEPTGGIPTGELPPACASSTETAGGIPTEELPHASARSAE